MCACVLACAQDTIRYVRVDGAYNNNGRSWSTAKNRVQDAINDLRDYLEQNNLTSGSVYIAAGTYVPTESTESSGGSMLNTSFKIYSGIHVYGGFNPDAPEETPGDRLMINGKKVSENWADQSGIGTTSGEEIASQWDLQYKTILTGNHSVSDVTFSYDDVRNRFNTTFPASSYHVVWFATNGKYTALDESGGAHYRPLDHPASLDGCVIVGGNASSRSTTTREHTAYGGGVYMVGNSSMRACTIERCNATLRGGGIYADGGGNIEFCYVHTCQTVGIGVYEGYGGGVCIDHEGSIGHSHITNCAARCGGGLLISHVPAEYPNVDDVSHYSPFATACVINNNTANAEGGGIYLAEGGTVNHCTVTANNCTGPDVTYYGRRHGRSGGIYVRNCGMIFNSVFWGNRCETNNDIQFASVHQKTDPTYEVFVYHSAFMNHDITDWTGATKETVFSLEKENFPIKGNPGNYCCFFEPTVDPVAWEETTIPIPGPGVFQSMSAEEFPGPRIWHLTSFSALDQKGVQVSEAVQNVSPWLIHAHTTYGVVSNPYEPVSTLGALVRQANNISYALVKPQGVEGRKSSTPIPTLFVDPNPKGVFDPLTNLFYIPDQEGNLWDVACKELGEAISFFRQYLVETDPADIHYELPPLDEDGELDLTAEKVRYNDVQILVKEGTLRTVGPGNYLGKDVRSAAVRMPSHLRLYGGYPSRLDSTNVAVRDPRNYRSILTANNTGESGLSGYENNSAHVIAMINCSHAIVDGFMLSNANTYHVYDNSPAVAGGGALVMNNAVTANNTKRIHMIGNELRNCILNNCTSPRGAAVFVNGEHPVGDSDDISYAELKMVNCVVRNNKTDFTPGGAGGSTVNHGIITANGRAYIYLDHCNIVNNVGYALKSESYKTNSVNPVKSASGETYRGYIRMDNSLLYCNADRALDDYTTLGTTGIVTSVNEDGQDYVYGLFNMFDADLALQTADAAQPHGFFQSTHTLPSIDGFVPAGLPSHLTTDAAGLASDRHNQCIFVRNDVTSTDYPTFVNPSRNIGNSATGDKPVYGGIISYTPMNTNPIVNAANPDGRVAEENYDRSDYLTRTRGGAPDIGAIEDADLPEEGTVIYVTPEGAGKRDGSSWSNAIAGNTVYRLYGAAAAEGDSIDAASGARLINKESGEPVTTEDNRYCGGFARKYEYPMYRNYTYRRISSTQERNVYIGGERDGEEEIVSSSSTPSDDDDTSAQWHLDGTIPDDPAYDPTLALDLRYPYGEMSGASRGMYRAAGNVSPIDEELSYTVNIATKTADGIAKSGQLRLTNERKENYVSGLQYAVEQASMRNKAMHRDSVQVWVGAGKYTDYKGYVMRDSVSVYGGFPITKYSAPGMNERKALMSNVVAIPKSVENKDLEATDYETILQISDVNPRKSDTEINPEAIKFKDDSASVKWQFTITTKDTLTTTTTHYLTWQTGRAEVSSTYMRYPDMLSERYVNVFGERHKDPTGGTANLGNTTTTGEWGGITWNNQKVVYQYFGTPWKNTYENHAWELVYEDINGNINYKSFKFDGNRNVLDAEGNKIGTVPRGMELNGFMSTMSVWQTMKNVPASEYELQIDLGALYNSNQSYEETGITFYILASNGDTLAQQEIYSPINTLRRYTFRFTQPATGDLTVRMMAAPGTMHVQPTNGKNSRRVTMANVHLYDLNTSSYIEDRTETEENVVKSSQSVSASYDLNWQKPASGRTTIRKRVLQMPDVTSPVYGNGLGNTVSSRGTIGDPLSHYERTTKAARMSNASGGQGKHDDPNYKEYNNAYWDGFTIRHGFVYDQHMAHGGGAGVQLFEGGHLVNCIVTDNFAGCYGVKGAGVFCDGSNSTIENCFILNNTDTKGSSKEEPSQLQGGGLFLYEGTCFNSLIANNYAKGPGGGLALCVGKFYNNTLAYNTSANGVGGLRIASGAESSILFANSIIYGNDGLAVDMTESADYAPFLNCYIQSQNEITKTQITHAINAHTTGGDGNYGVGNKFYNGRAADAGTSPFAADVNAGGTYTGNAKTNNDFALRQVDTIRCINSGTEDFYGALESALADATTTAISEAKRTVYRKAVAGVELPSNDVVYADRVQDCQVDIGAYEYNAAYDIKPDTITHPGHAIFYISYASPGGDASASSPANAACLQKMQKVFDAAGRYKYKLMTVAAYNKGDSIIKGDTIIPKQHIASEPNKYWDVEVWLTGDTVSARLKDDYLESLYYTPTRSTKHNISSYQDNTLDYSFIIPRGIQVRGGYKDGYYHYENAAGDTVPEGTADAHIVDDRDPLTYRTVLSGVITSSTGAEGNTYHVVTFTEDLFDANEKYFTTTGAGPKVDIRNQLASFNDALQPEAHRAVLDGLFIEDGNADAPIFEDRIGGGAVVTDYAHIRNCVVRSNSAEEAGGGLYMQPFALVSGTIIRDNTASKGGGIYIEAPESHNKDSLARVFTSTICENQALSSAGGMWFDNTYARVNSCVLWHNTANDNANVSGVFTRTDEDTDYPFSFCAVESRRLEGQGNIELSPTETEGVRWDRQDPFNAVAYYPIEMSSTLSRAGTTYTEWNKLQFKYPTLDTMDIAGVHRAQWTSDGSGRIRGFAWRTDTLVTKNNALIDIGARAINKDFDVKVDERYVMRRLYVMHTDLIDSKAARALQDNPNTDDVSNMYRQMGSCIINPFHRLSDAFNYVIETRFKDPEKYRNVRFEIFVEQGTYYPFQDAYRRQGEVRMNTFLVPEAVLIVGGVDSRPADHKYGQEGFKSPFGADGYISLGTGDDVPIPGTEYTINYETTDNIRLRDADHRPMRDNNLNSVIEPWELERQTILSGNAVSGDDFTHIYHVITCHADDRYVGPRPRKHKYINPEYNSANPVPGSHLLIDSIGDYDGDHWKEENDLSILARTIGFDGVQITGGYANHVDESDVHEIYNTKTYFRGGGIFVDGTWSKYSGGTPPDLTRPAKYNIPIVVENCLFTNNMAGTGGALYSNGGIYMFGCHFTQNYSQGPMTKLDQQYIPWTAGGCINANATCAIANTLFANNEARRGLYPVQVETADSIPDADARQGFGGAISVGAQASLRIMNCHFVRNKAVAYPAIYNFLSNNRAASPDSMDFVFNTLFWGNEVFEVDNIGEIEHIEAPTQEAINAFNLKYKASRSGVFHYDGSVWNRYEKLFHEYDSLYHHYFTTKTPAGIVDTFNVKVTDKLAELRAVGDSLEGMYFCSYRQGYGPTGMKPTTDGYLLTREELKAWVDPRRKPTPITHGAAGTGDVDVNYANLFTYLHGNNNTLINRVNTATDGPNFKQPSYNAGIDGYMQNADWLPARMNQTTDQGWGYLKQTVERGISYYITKYTGTEQFKTAEEALVAAKKVNPSATAEDVYPVKGLPVASFDDVQDSPGAIYNLLSKRFGAYMSKTNQPLPMGDDYYMHYSRSSSDGSEGNMDRISKNPQMGETEAFIDLGIYEYQHVQLDIKGQEIDTMWVATKERGTEAGTGLTWESPTTDMQMAIDLLMSSHNNHDKYICLLGDEEGGTFSPTNILDNRRAFVITSTSLAPIMPDSAQADHDYGVKSLNFLGGYSFDVKDAARDPNAHPTVIEMPNAGNKAQLNQLFVIEDMTRQVIQATFLGEYTARSPYVIPITFDGITFVNPHSVKDASDTDAYSNIGGTLAGKGGAAIYYRWQRQYESKSGIEEPNFKMSLLPDTVTVDNERVAVPKLTISNCTFMDNGDRTVSTPERSPAVRIDDGGGSSLIVNSLFHSNAGAPVYGRHTDAHVDENDNYDQVSNPVVIVNSTFALNDGHLRLGEANSEVHNSLIWKDDLSSDTLVQLQIGASQWDKTDNRNAIGTDSVTNNAIWHCFQAGDDTYHNDQLLSENTDVFEGPNFIAPMDTATLSSSRRARDFRLNPGVKTMNKADTALYRRKVFFCEYPDASTVGTNNLWRRPLGFKSAYITALAQDSDLAAKPRLFGQSMERGAYECRAVLQRVLYVQPNLPETSAGDGSSWETPFGQGQLQKALDAAAVYTYLTQDINNIESRRAYVYVKGSNESEEPLHVIARDGVSVFGSLPNGFTDEAYVKEGDAYVSDAECRRYVNYVRAITAGVAALNATPTRISSLKTSSEKFKVGVFFSGFLFTNPGETLTESPLYIGDTMTIVRNCVFADNKMAPGVPVADVRHGLLYNSLLYNDTADVIVKIGEGGLVLNNTILAARMTDQPINTEDAQDASIQVLYNIAVNADTAHCFAPYRTTNNPYTLPTYLTNYLPLTYQLHEHSDLINGGVDTTTSLPLVYKKYADAAVLNFAVDRDVLGNPRRIGSRVDIGALETWKVEPKTAREISSLTDVLITREECISADSLHSYNAFVRNYGGHKYPHPGSVVYLMDSAVMTMQYATANDFKDFHNNPIILRPGFVLLKPGASFYGNGHSVEMNYIAAEKRFINQRYSMTSFPYNYSTANITTTTYDDTEGSLNSQLSPFTFTTYQYNGAARSAKDYTLQANNSSLWLPVDTLNRTATDGYLMDFGTAVDTVLRFNAFAPAGQYIYTENGDDKYVYLDQHDHRTAGSGSTLNFTSQENMGWNMKGLPWLVTNYRTDTILWEDNYLRQMHIPHVFYQMDGAGDYLTKGDQVYTSRSWDKGSTVSIGKAFLTQTATTQDREMVTFHLPLYGRNEKADRPLLRMMSAGSHGVTSDILTLIVDSSASKNIAYAYGRDGIKWMTDDGTPQLYLLDSRYISHISLLGAAPLAVDIPLGVKSPTDETYTFSLPEKKAFDGYEAVWLIDYQKNKFTNLLTDTYEVAIPAGETNRRFAIRIDGVPKRDDDGYRQYVVFTSDGNLYVRGIVPGDRISVYTTTGQLVQHAIADANEYMMPLYFQSGFVVRVNEEAYKVVNW